MIIPEDAFEILKEHGICLHTYTSPYMYQQSLNTLQIMGDPVVIPCAIVF